MSDLDYFQIIFVMIIRLKQIQVSLNTKIYESTGKFLDFFQRSNG